MQQSNDALSPLGSLVVILQQIQLAPLIKRMSAVKVRGQRQQRDADIDRLISLHGRPKHIAQQLDLFLHQGLIL